MPPESSNAYKILKQSWYRLLQSGLKLLGVLYFGVRRRFEARMPAEGSVLVLSNHQSHLDPMLVAVVCNRKLNFLARQSLFDFKPLGWLIHSLDAIPLDRDGLGLAGLKETLRRLKRGEAVLVFPEGTRSPDGAMGPLKPGFISLARRGKAALVPMGISGAYECWPRKTRWPRTGRIWVEFGSAISPEQVASLDDEALLAEVERRIRQAVEIATDRRGHASRR